MAALAAAVIFAVPLMLWYQSSRDDKGTDNGVSRHNYNQFYNVLAGMALSPENPECDEALLLCVDNLKRHKYHTAVLTWLRYGAERGSSPPSCWPMPTNWDPVIRRRRNGGNGPENCGPGNRQRRRNEKAA